MGRLIDGVGPPDFIAGLGVQRDYVAAESAAAVSRACRGPLLARRDRNVQPAFVQLGRSSDARDRMGIESFFPEQFPGRRVQSIGLGAKVSEICDVARTDGDRSSYPAIGLEAPVRASVG